MPASNPIDESAAFACASRRTWTPGQAACYLLAAGVLAALVWREPQEAPLWAGVLALAGYALVVCVRTVAVLAGLLLHDLEQGGVESGAPDAAWPVYTVLLPVYREAGVLPALMRSLAALDYPRDRLDVILLVEEDDPQTRAAAGGFSASWLRVLVVPPGEPRTKPRACNVGLRAARGTFLVVFDAEDRPERDQLKKAVRAFGRLPETVACLQARLNYYNAADNLLTRCFALEYAAWFDLYLPGLHSLRGVIPLGGTSNHFRTPTLRRLQGWDPWNVTEDCELGVRLARAGLETRILDSTTWEEAVSQPGPWLRQRSRWVKGYWQTHLVHTRSPLDTIRRLGLWRALLMLLTVGGQVAVLLANPVCWLLAALWLCHPWPLHDPARPLSRALLVGSVGLALCNLLFVVIHALAAVRRRRLDLLPACLLMPCYWLLVSAGAWRGVMQSFTAPFYWEKTPHGLRPGTGVEDLPVICDFSGSEEPVVERPPGDRPPSSPADAPRRTWHRWASVGVVCAVLAAIAFAATPLARWVTVAFGVISVNGPGACGEQPVEEDWIGRREATFTLRVDPGAWALPRAVPVRAMPLAAIVYVKVGDGTYFERRIRHLACPLGAGPASLTVAVPLDSGWRSDESGAPWGAWCLRRVRAAGVRVYGPDGPPQEARLLSVAARGDTPVPPLAAHIRSRPKTGAVWQRWEARFTLSREYANPFDPQEVDVWGVFTSATGAVVRVPAFYTCDYTRESTGTNGEERLSPAGAPGWAVRFLPPAPGAWRWRLEARDRSGGATVTPEHALSVAAATTAGPVRVVPGEPWFRRANGNFFYPVTLNIRSPDDVYTDDASWPLYTPGAPNPAGGARVMEEYLRRMGSSGITLGRVWMSPWFGGLEWSGKWNGFHGLGQYSLQNAWRIDRVLDAAETRGVLVELALQPHGPFTRNYDVQWDDNPYNRRNGGPLEDPAAVMTDPGARRWMSNRLRYCAARWGASPALFGWLLWIEANAVNRDDSDLLSWHREAAELLRRIDPGRHPVTTEFQGAGICRAIWDEPDIHYIQCPAYNFGNGLCGSFDETRDAFAGATKPLFIEEYGGSYQGGDPRWVAHEIHDGLWLGWVEPYAASPMSWWWNFIFARGLDRYHARFAAYIRGEDLSAHSWRYVRSVVSGAPFLRLRARAADDRADLWLYGPASDIRGWGASWSLLSRNWRQLAGAFDPLAEDPGRLFDVPAGMPLDLAALRLRDGDYRVEIWDTWSTNAPARTTISIRNRAGSLPLPALQRDAAVRIRPLP
ncbi:MAG: glycosyltransferase [bacterium]